VRFFVAGPQKGLMKVRYRLLSAFTVLMCKAACLFQRFAPDSSACILIAWRQVPSICDGGRHEVGEQTTIYVVIDVSKDKLAVAPAFPM